MTINIKKARKRDAFGRYAPNDVPVKFPEAPLTDAPELRRFYRQNLSYGLATCQKCNGNGGKTSPNTGWWIKCRTCKGSGYATMESTLEIAPDDQPF